MASACTVKYIQNNYKGYPDLISKLTDIYHEVWRKIDSSKLFRVYGSGPTATYLLSSKGTTQYKKQVEFAKKLNIDYNVPKGSSIIRSELTKAGNNTKILVNVHSIAQQVYEELQRAKPAIQGELFAEQRVIEPISDVEIADIYRDKIDYLKVQNLPIVPFFIFKSKARNLEDSLRKMNNSTKETILEALKCL